MDKINLQDKTKAVSAVIESYWFEDESIGLEKTLFHKISIPLEPFDSGLDYEEQPLETLIVCDWYKLQLSNPENLDGIDMNHDIYTDAEASVYVGCAHNWCHVKKLSLELISPSAYQISGELLVEFENEGVGENETFNFTTVATYAKA
jgi:hypothetical protein